MLMKKTVAVVLAMSLTALAFPSGLLAQSKGQILGTAKDEARKPYEDYQVRARVVGNEVIAATTGIDDKATFSLASLVPGKYMIELYNLKEKKVVCTEGPVELTEAQLLKKDVEIDCGRLPVAWLLLAAAGAAGITAGIVTRDASGSK
ncbi:MAG: hypothetical protein ACE148_15640 [Vicinamibacterales bacterium]